MAPAPGIDEEERLAVGVEGHEDRSWGVGDERVAETDLRRAGLGAAAGVGSGDEADVGAVNLAQGDQMLGIESRSRAPALAHGPGVGTVAGGAEADVPIRHAHARDAPRQCMGDSR